MLSYIHAKSDFSFSKFSFGLKLYLNNLNFIFFITNPNVMHLPTNNIIFIIKNNHIYNQIYQYLIFCLFPKTLLNI